MSISARLVRRLVVLALALLCCASAGLLLLDVLFPIDLTRLEQASAVPSSLIVDRNGLPLYEVIDPQAGSQRAATLEDITPSLLYAVIATEDATFYDNLGFSPRAILRAVWLNVRHGAIVSGGSTITQQVARQLLLSTERYDQSLSRKLRETWLAYRLTRVLSKDQILTLYLNQAHFGNLAIGVESAATMYFAKPAHALSLGEAALLAGLPQAPTSHDPILYPEAAKRRQHTVLELMVRAGYIDQDAADRAFREPLQYASRPFDIKAPHFVMAVLDEMDGLVDAELLTAGGLRIETTLDWGLQREAEREVQRHLALLNAPTRTVPGHRVSNAAAVALGLDGAVRVMVGSPDYFDSEKAGAVNAALALRQPGSALKPFTYAAAFEQGMSPATVVSDVRTSFVTQDGHTYVPMNYDRRFRGPVSLREALASSYNVVAVKVLDQLGVQALPDMALRVGIDTLVEPERQGLALTLGSAEVRLLDLTAAYATLGNSGYLVRPYLIQRVVDAADQVLYEYVPPAPISATDPRIAYLITDVLADERARIPGFGQNTALDLPFPAAVKTGTSTNWRDNWAVGYTSEGAVGVWVGNHDGTPMERATGVTGAAPVWNQIMRSVHRIQPAPFSRPKGLVEIEVCAGSGLLPGAACHQRRRELFLAENVPTEPCSMHELVAIDVRTGGRADSSTPHERQVLRTVTHWPADALAWADDQGLLQPLSSPPSEPTAGPSGLPAASGEQVHLTSPDHLAVYRMSDELDAAHQQLEIRAVCSVCSHGNPVDLLINGERAHRWTSPPYRTLWRLSPGLHIFEIVVHAPLESIHSDPIEITVLSAAHQRGGTP